MATVQITLIKSVSGSLKKHKATAEALGLKKVGQTVTREDNAVTRGMIAAVAHLVRVTKE